MDGSELKCFFFIFLRHETRWAAAAHVQNQKPDSGFWSNYLKRCSYEMPAALVSSSVFKTDRLLKIGLLLFFSEGWGDPGWTKLTSQY